MFVYPIVTTSKSVLTIVGTSLDDLFLYLTVSEKYFLHCDQAYNVNG